MMTTLRSTLESNHYCPASVPTGRCQALVAILSALVFSSASAQVTYFDGVWGPGGNTTYLDGSEFTPGPNNAPAGDDLWRLRTGGTGFGHNSTIMESNGNASTGTTNPENAPMLRTTISGLMPNTDYNIYGYFWSQTSALQDWKLKATINPADINDNGTPGNMLDDFLPTTLPLSFSKFGSATAPVATNSPALADGFDIDNLGVAYDTDGLSTSSYFTAPTRIKSVDNTLAMFQAILGVATSDGTGQVNVYIDDLEEQLSANNRTWYDGVGFALAGQPQLTIDRSTGAMVFTTGVARDIIGYSITSVNETLNQANWTTVAGHYDAAVGADGTVDDNDTWLVLSDPASSSDLSEAELGDTGPLDGALLEPGTVINFGTPWRKYFVEDVRMQILLNDAEGTIETVPVVYTENSGVAYPEGDFNFNGSVGPEDYTIFIGNLFADLPASRAAAYAFGDLTGDFKTNLDDIKAFRVIYDANNGAGAFQALVDGQVPEPQTLFLVACAAAMLFVTYRRREALTTLQTVPVSCGRSLAAVVAVLLLCSSAAMAQTTYVDATDGVGGNTTLLDGSTFTATAAAAADGLWRERALANNGSIFEANANGSENAHMLLTTVTGLTPGAEYNVYGYFWSNPTQNWRLKATLNPADIDDNGTPGDVLDDFLGNIPAYSFSSLGSGTTTTAPLAVPEHFGPPVPIFLSSGTVMFEASLGTIAADGGGAVKVYVDDLENQTSATFRTWYDGIGYEQIRRLTLQVNTVTGEARIANESGAPVALSYYEITSAMDSLNPGGWLSLDAQNIDAVDGDDVGDVAGDSQLEGWDAGGGSDTDLIGEVNFLSSSTLGNFSFYSLGNAYQTGDPQDLEFNFEWGTRKILLSGNVEYMTSFPVYGDYNGDGNVNGADYVLWRKDPASYGGPGGYDVWRANFGTSSGAGSGLGGSESVPEPNTLALLGIIAVIGGMHQMRNRKTSRSVRASLVGSLVVAALVIQSVDTVQAAVTNDREFLFGDPGSADATLAPPAVDVAANVGEGNPMGFVFNGITSTGDETGPTGAFLDLEVVGATYTNTAARPNGSAGDFGAQFDGLGDYLAGTPLNRPDELATILGSYHFNYTGITARGLQMWVYPNAAPIGVRRQTIVMDTVTAGGVAITESGLWTQIHDGHFDDDDITPSVPVVGNQWYHVMQHVYRSFAPGSPTVVPGSGTVDLSFTGVVYVNGIAVSASNDTPNVGDSDTGSRVGVLVVGAEELPDLDGTSATPIIGNYFDGVVDNLKMYVYGDNTSLGGQDYGTFNLFADNEWIATEITNTVPGGMLKNGDLNRDGDVTLADVDAFVDGWLHSKLLVGAHNSVTAGDWETWGWGDMDHDGIVYLHDAFLMQKAMILAGLGSSLFDRLGGAVPEPNAALLVIWASGIWIMRHRRRRRPAAEF